MRETKCKEMWKMIEIIGLTETQRKMITENGGGIKLYINSEKVESFEIGDCADISFPNGYNKARRVYKGYAPALNTTTTQNNFIIKEKIMEERKNSQEMTKQLIEDVNNDKLDSNEYYGKHLFQSSRFEETPTENIAATIKASKVDSGVINNYRIRKLTPRECFRLMGVKDEDIDKIAKNQSCASMYHLAGDSIVVQVLENLYKNLNIKIGE